MFKFLFILFLIIVFVPPVRRFFFWLLVGRQLVKEQKKAHQRYASKEGDIKVDHVPPGATDSKIQGGDYVDYEEVK
ncbi:DUF4834 domain-containing protein [Tellurirhabdus rosea]|uniref:DUF4834 domain-containing protein n=1 Tax=Tellurirhabdus rosea TaxID=2674997 RepID=UPI00224CF9B4|nr:DUF4834 domain-containing protein [Tellurirhabdus rosea]